MAKFSFDMEAYSYTQGIKAIQLMFEAAKSTLNAQHFELDDAKIEYDRHLERGGEPIGEWEDGYKLWDQEDVYRLEQLALEEAIAELRVATVIAIYHLWERHIPNSRSQQRNHERLILDARARSISLHPNINALCYAANYLKHGSEKWLEKLETEHPDRFLPSTKNSKNWPAAFRKLQLKDTDIEWFIEIASISQRPITELRGGESNSDAN